MGGKATVWTLEATNKQNLPLEDLVVAKKGKPQERNWTPSNKQRYKDQSYQSKNWYSIKKISNVGDMVLETM